MGPVRSVLEAAGYPVVAPLLSGHGTRVEDLFTRRWEDWYADVLRSATNVLATSDQRPATVFYVGMSLGALLGLRLAIDKPGWLAGVVCIGTPLTLFPWMRAMYALVHHTPLRWLMRTWPKKFELAVADPAGREVYRQSSYARFPLPAVREVRRLQQSVRRDLHRITTPLLMMHARKDFTAPPEAMEIVARQARGPVEQVWLERSYHVATLDYEREVMSARILTFLRTINV